MPLLVHTAGALFLLDVASVTVATEIYYQQEPVQESVTNPPMGTLCTLAVSINLH